MNSKSLARLIIIFSCLLYWGNIRAQQNYSGTKAPYIFHDEKYTPAPEGFKPVFVEYVGRHASRFFTKAGADTALPRIMETEDLTLFGKKILAAVKKMYDIQKNEYGNITLSGRDELIGIGRRIKQQYPSVWQNNGIDITLTDEVRTHQSKDAFMQGFGQYDPSKINTYNPPDSLNNTLRFYDISPTYKKYKKSNFIKNKIDSLLQNPRIKRVSDDVCRKIFIDCKNKDSWQVTEDLYDMYCLIPLIKKEIKAQGMKENDFDIFEKAFTEKGLQWLDFVNNAEDFYEKGPGENINGIQIKIAAPLLVDLLNNMEKEIQEPDHSDAKFNFTHAEAISPLATLMEIPLASRTAASVFDYAKNWHADEIIPMTSNVQWILYSNGKSYLVKVLLNEKEIHLPISTKTFPYYNWEDVKDFYTKKLASYGIDEKTDLHTYLLELNH